MSGYFAYGSVENRANTLIGNSSYLPGQATWNNDVFTFGLKANWNIKVTDKTTLTPFIGIDYVHREQESFTETYSNGSRQYRDDNMQVWSVPVGITVKKEVSAGGGQLLLPELTFAYVRGYLQNESFGQIHHLRYRQQARRQQSRQKRLHDECRNQLGYHSKLERRSILHFGGQKQPD